MYSQSFVPVLWLVQSRVVSDVHVHAVVPLLDVPSQHVLFSLYSPQTHAHVTGLTTTTTTTTTATTTAATTTTTTTCSVH